jgi:hypothetical protein
VTNLIRREGDHLVVTPPGWQDERGAVAAGLVVRRPCTRADLPMLFTCTDVGNDLPEDGEYMQEVTAVGDPTGRFFVWPAKKGGGA